jgi:F-type H+-transporting ATPase subunit epsilon
MDELSKNTILLEIVTPESKICSKPVYMVNMPGAYGEFGVMHGHVALLAGIKPGLVTIYDSDMKILEHIFVASGFAEINEESAILLVEKAVNVDECDIDEISNRLAIHKEDFEIAKTQEDKENMHNNIMFHEELLILLRNFKGDGAIH